jgi:hypothetical protein
LPLVEISGFYNHLSDLGLRYGEEFRPIRELAAGDGRSAGRVSLSEKVAPRAGEYRLHPVLLDGALQVFSAGAATVEGRKARLKLPVRFDKILFLQSPGASCLVEAGVQQCGDEFVVGRIQLYDEAGKPCAVVDGFRAISMNRARRSGAPGSREILYHVHWERTQGSPRRSSQQPLSLGRLEQAARSALEQVMASRGREKLEASLAACDDLAAAQVAKGLCEMDPKILAKAIVTADSLGVAESMQPIFDRLLSKLAQRGLLSASADGYQATEKFDTLANSADQEF